MNNAAAHRLQLAKWCKLHNIPAPSGPAVDAFVAEMGANQYGVEETWDAFVWFRHGWEAALNFAIQKYSPLRSLLDAPADDDEQRRQEDDAAMGGGSR